MKMREILEKELKMKHHLLESPSHQKVTHHPVVSQTTNRCVVFVTYFTAHFLNWRFNHASIIQCCTSLS